MNCSVENKYLQYVINKMHHLWRKYNKSNVPCLFVCPWIIWICVIRLTIKCKPALRFTMEYHTSKHVTVNNYQCTDDNFKREIPLYLWNSALNETQLAYNCFASVKSREMVIMLNIVRYFFSLFQKNALSSWFVLKPVIQVCNELICINYNPCTEKITYCGFVITFLD